MARNSDYIKYLPQIYQTSDPTFLREFLSIFSNVITEMRVNPTTTSGQNLPDEAVEQIVDRLHEFFDPLLTPSDDNSLNNPEMRNFLDYLADWVSLIEKYKLPEIRKRRSISCLIPLYKERGTKGGLKRFLELFTGFNTVTIFDTPAEKDNFSATLSNELNVNMLTSTNYTFGVQVDIRTVEGFINNTNVETARELMDLINRIVQREKPAHTDAVILLWYTNAMQVGVICTIGSDTTIGRGPKIVESVNGIVML